MIDGLLVVIRPYDRAPKKFDEVGEVKIVKKTAHRPSVSTKRPRSADGKSSRTARVLKSSSSEKEKKKLPLSSNAPRRAVSKSIRGGKPTGLASLAKVATRVLPERMVRSEAYKRAQAAEEAKEDPSCPRRGTTQCPHQAVHSQCGTEDRGSSIYRAHYSQPHR